MPKTAPKVSAASSKQALTKRKGSRGKAPEALRDKPSVRKLNNIDYKRRFIEGMCQYGTITKACAHAGMSGTLYYYWTDPHYGEGKYYDEDFVHEVSLAKAAWRDVLRDEAQRRAVDGVKRPVFGSMGFREGSGIIGHVQEYSDRLLEVLLKLNTPEGRAVGGEGKTTVNVDARSVHQTMVNFDPKAMSQDQRDKMRAFIESMKITSEQDDVIEGEVDKNISS